MKSEASRSLREKLVSEVEKYGFLKFGAEVGREDGVFDEEAGFFFDGTLGFESFAQCRFEARIPSGFFDVFCGTMRDFFGDFLGQVGVGQQLPAVEILSLLGG